VSASTLPNLAVRSDPPTGVRRLLHRADAPELSLLRGHRSLYARPEATRRKPAEVIAMIEASGLRGRGGAGFPAATKLRAVAKSGRRSVVVVNGTEGEPASRKDAMLLQVRPHLVLDGAVRAAAAIGAPDIFVCIDRENSVGVRAMEHALDERRRAEPGGPAITVLGTPPRYVAGEETALVHWLNGGDAKPTTTPPRPFERGVAGRPTLINNAETLAHLAQIVQFGPAWFRSTGTESEPGTALATVSGAVDRPAVYEMPMGLALADLLRAAGTPDGVAGVLVGGYFGSWLAPEVAAQVRLSNEALRPLGGGFGCGMVAVLPAGGCGVSESARVLTWMAAETAGQCGACVNGLDAIATTYNALAAGSGRTGDIATLERWATQIEGRGACRFPDGAIRFLRSALTLFRHDLMLHANGNPCAAARRPALLPVPRSGGGWR
jgi:NADH:ubiquinone oxidoreductase subunit F (NADH-binding)